MEDFSLLTDSIMKAVQQVEEQMLINDILDIYNEKYPTYDLYKAQKRALAQMARNNNDKMWEADANEIKYSYYIEPKILSKETFAYICLQKGKEKYK